MGRWLSVWLTFCICSKKLQSLHAKINKIFQETDADQFIICNSCLTRVINKSQVFLERNWTYIFIFYIFKVSGTIISVQYLLNICRFFTTSHNKSTIPTTSLLKRLQKIQWNLSFFFKEKLLQGLLFKSDNSRQATIFQNRRSPEGHFLPRLKKKFW